MNASRDNMGDQIAYNSAMQFWDIVWWVTLVINLTLILVFWYVLFRKEIKRALGVGLMLLAAFVLAGCTSQTVIITPPNYGILIDLKSPSNQATANDFGNGELLNVTQVTVGIAKCSPNSVDDCPDKLVAEVQGQPESRIYTQDPNTGTAGANQALCFDAQGTNGCMDFSVTAIIERNNARFYANKMGVKPVIEDNQPSRFHFKATPLAEALDTRVIQITQAEFAKVVSAKSPLVLSAEKFALFEGTKDRIKQVVMEQTCITILDMGVNGGIVWDSASVQETIDEATILASRTELAARENEVANLRIQGTMARMDELTRRYGVDAAVRIMEIERWDGSYMPTVRQQPSLQSTAPVTGTAQTQP